MDFGILAAAYGYVAYRVWKKSRNIWATLAAPLFVHIILGNYLQKAVRSFTGTGQREEPFHGGSYPYALAPKCGSSTTLSELYRRLHNLEAISRAQVFQFNSAYAGGNQNTPAEPFIGEAYDRERMRILALIQEEIRCNRAKVSGLHPNGSPLGGSYDDCASSNYDAAKCQYQMDKEGRILGIPSQVGSTAYYY